jgi:hypothetical protein
LLQVSSWRLSHYLQNGAACNETICIEGRPSTRGVSVKDHYDFSVAERGKFYRADTEIHFPVFLAPDVNEFLTKLAEQKKIAVDDLGNELPRADMNIIQSAGS